MTEDHRSDAFDYLTSRQLGKQKALAAPYGGADLHASDPRAAAYADGAARDVKVHHAYPLAQRTDCGRKFFGRLVRGDTIICSNGKGLIKVSNVAQAVTCKKCESAQP